MYRRFDIDNLRIEDDEMDEEEINEPTMEEVLFQLQKYPKVRDKNWQGSLEISTVPKHTPIKSNQVVAQEDQITNSKADFWTNLEHFLQQHYEKGDAEKIFIEFQNSHKKYVQSLSLDHIERLATNMKNNNPKIVQ
jgi:ssDNA-specific exonuclease RecJ